LKLSDAEKKIEEEQQAAELAEQMKFMKERERFDLLNPSFLIFRFFFLLFFFLHCHIKHFCVGTYNRRALKRQLEKQADNEQEGANPADTESAAKDASAKIEKLKKKASQRQKDEEEDNDEDEDEEGDDDEDDEEEEDEEDEDEEDDDEDEDEDEDEEDEDDAEEEEEVKPAPKKKPQVVPKQPNANQTQVCTNSFAVSFDSANQFFFFVCLL
jgi:chemotaxis protein histidine kinase CheA